MLNLFSRPFVAALILVGVAACGGEVAGGGESNIEVAREVSGLGAGCTFYRPIIWDGPNQCIENASSHLQLADGEFFSNSGYGILAYGYGAYGVSCHDGELRMEYMYCNYGDEP